MKRQFVTALVCVLAMGLGATAATPGAIWYVGRDQGPIPGDHPFGSLPGASHVVAYYQTFSAVVNPADCVPSKENQSSPFTIVKEIDRASPNLLLAFKNRESLDVVLRLYRTTPEGVQQNYFTITPKGAMITGIRQELPFTQDPQLAHYTHLERVSFVYKSIVWEHVDTELKAGMEWEARCDTPLFSDLNFDGTVNILDFSIMADEWLSRGYY